MVTPCKARADRQNHTPRGPFSMWKDFWYASLGPYRIYSALSFSHNSKLNSERAGNDGGGRECGVIPRPTETHPRMEGVRHRLFFSLLNTFLFPLKSHWQSEFKFASSGSLNTRRFKKKLTVLCSGGDCIFKFWPWRMTGALAESVSVTISQSLLRASNKLSWRFPRAVIVMVGKLT